MVHRRPWILAASSALVIALLPSSYTICAAFLSPSHLSSRPSTISCSSSTTASTTSTSRRNAIIDGNQQQQQPDAPKTIQEDADLQWELYTRHQAVSGGEWWGNWMTYNYMGDLVDSSVVGVSLQPNDDLTSVTHTHRILSSSTQSDCPTCFSSSQVTTLPTIATHTSTTLGKRHRCASVGMVVGPSVLKSSGAMSTELVLRHGNGRVRVTFQHAPVWERGVEPGSCPPQGLKLFRAVVSKERLRSSSSSSSSTQATATANNVEGNNDDDPKEGMIIGQPSAEEEMNSPPLPGNPRFFRPVPPYKWHAKWAGTSWTWGPQTGDRGWSIQEIDEADSWHGRPRGDATSVWSLTLPGGVLIQCPRVIVGGMAGICRLAWLPEDDGEVGSEWDGNTAKLLRVEASVSALEPIISDDDENMMVGFYPPTLGSLRTDILEKIGELEGASLEERAQAAEGYVWSADGEESESIATTMASGESSKQENERSSSQIAPNDEDLTKKIVADPRNALDF